MDMTIVYGKMLVAIFLIEIVVMLCYFVDKKTREKLGMLKVKRLILGVIFGVLAYCILSLGVSIHGALDNIQDVVPLCAGLIFGAPVGLIAGVLSGALIIGFPPGDFVQVPVSISLCISGVFAAFLRHFIFDSKTTTPFYGMAAGLVVAVIHLLTLLVSHIDNNQSIYAAFSGMTLPVLIASAIAAMLALYLVAAIGKEKITIHTHKKGIAQTFQRWLLVCILAAFAATCTYSWILQTALAERNADNLLRLNLMDLHADIVDISNKNLLRIARQVASRITPAYYVNEWNGRDFHNSLLSAMTGEYNIVEVNLIDSRGINIASTEPDFPGYNMANGQQSSEFLALLHGQKELVQEYQPISSNQSIFRKYAGVALPNGGFAQVGYDAEHFQNSLDEAVNGLTRNKHIGETGGIIICDDSGLIISDNDTNGNNEGLRLKDIGLSLSQDFPVNTSFSFSFGGVDYRCMYDKAEGYLIITYIPYQEVMFYRNIAGYITAFMEIVLFAVIFLLIYFLVKKIVVDNIHKINNSLAQISGGNLNVRIDVHTNDEFTSLSEDINATVDTLKKYIAEAAARIDKELEFARTIQQSALPSIFPPYPDRAEFDLFASMDAAKEVGGDFYDFYLLDRNRLAFLIADVSGKGIPAAMFMMTSKTLIKSLAESGVPLAEVFNEANERLCENNDAGMFITAWMGILHIDTGLVEFVNAGHNPPLLKQNGEFTYLRSQAGFVLAGIEAINYEVQQVQLEAGDTLLLYTDGLTEAMNTSEELFGEDRVLAALAGKPDMSARDLIAYLKESVAVFVDEAEQSDDITMLVLTFKGKNKQ